MAAILKVSPDAAFRRKTLLALLLLAALLPGLALAADFSRIAPPLQQQLAKAAPDKEIPVIVRMHGPVDVRLLAVPTREKGFARARARSLLVQTLQSRAEQSRPPLQAVLNRHGVYQTRQLWLINGAAFRATPALIEELALMPEVASIEFDQRIQLPEVLPAQIPGPAEANITLINAPELWALGFAGQGATVAIVDSGVDINHPDLGPRWRGGSNSWYDPNGEHTTGPVDLDGHGTHVTGVVLGGDHGGTFIGVAPEADWIGVKIFADDGGASYSAIHAGLQWLLDPDGDVETDDAPDVINNSWGFELNPDQCIPEFQSDVRALRTAGIAVVFSAGNTSEDVPPPNSVAPANYPESFAVGSVGTDSSDIEISFFSAGGPSACDDSIYPELVAPGFAIKTSDLTEEGALNSYVTVTGTSFSAPHVSGAMALLLGAFPETSVTALETALKQSATDLGPAGRDNVYGYGLVDVLAAYSVLREAVNTPPVAPQPVLPADGATVGTSVTFSWQPASDADGDAVSQFLVYSSHEDFSAATTLPVDSVTQAMLGGSLLLGIQLFGLIRRRRKLCLALVLSGLLLAMVACGGGGGGGGNDSEPQPETQSITVNNFVAGTYYWKMVARDSRGAETESGVRSFVVQ